jgi:hypothetical protein
LTTPQFQYLVAFGNNAFDDPTAAAVSVSANDIYTLSAVIYAKTVSGTGPFPSIQLIDQAGNQLIDVPQPAQNGYNSYGVIAPPVVSGDYTVGATVTAVRPRFNMNVDALYDWTVFTQPALTKTGIQILGTGAASGTSRPGRRCSKCSTRPARR